MQIAGVYIHIPFCGKICPFCSFAVVKDDPRKHKTHLDCIHKEMKLLWQKKQFDFSRLRSVYFGGGTPSRLSIEELKRLTSRLRSSFNLDLKTSAQWSIEVNPEDISTEYALGLKELGFSRVSLGVQSFQDQSLKTLGRTHTAENSLSAIQILRQAGIKNINIDLMYGYPGHTKQSLKTDLLEFINQKPAHISAYCLNIEKKTAIFRKPKWREWQKNNENLIYEMFHQVANTLQNNGFKQYEISNFSQKGYRSPQNIINWTGENYLGIGAGAHSFVAPFRWGNYKRLAEYRKLLQNNSLPQEYHEKLSPEQQLDEELMLGLRMTEGLELSKFTIAHKVDARNLWKKEIQRLEKLSLLKIKDDRLILTLKGMLLADEITTSLASLTD